MAKNNGSQQPPPGGDQPVLGDLLGTARDRRTGGTRIEPAPTGVVEALRPEVADRATGAATAAAGSDHAGRRRLVGAVLFAVIAAAGAYVGLRSPSVGDALRTVSVVLVGAAVLIYLAAFVLWARDRGRRRRTTAPVAEAPAVTEQATATAGGRPRVPTLAEVAAELDGGSDVPIETAVAPATSAVGVPSAPPATAPSAPAAPVPPPPVVVAAPVPPVPAVVAAVVPSAPIAAPVPRAPVAAAPVVPPEHDIEVMDAIAPYTEVVGQPVIRELVVAHATTGTAPAPPPPPPARSSVPPPPPPARAVVPPPPPVLVEATAVRPEVVSPPPPARTAAEVFAAMTAAGTAAPVGEPAPAIEPVPTPPSLPVQSPVEGEPAAAIGLADEPTVVDLFGASEPPMIVPSVNVPGWTPPMPAVPAGDEGRTLGHLPRADVTARSAVGSVAPVIVYRYRKWVLGQMMPGASFGPLDVDRSPDEWLLLATCGVATLLAWTHEDHHFTYPVETWAEEILPAYGVRIRDRELARDLVLAAALHAGGVDSVPTERLRTYAPSDLVTAMASIHVGLLRLYCGLGRIGPDRVLADQYGIGPGDIPLH